MKYETIFRANNVNGNIMSNVEVTKDGRHYYPNDDLWNILIENGYWLKVPVSMKSLNARCVEKMGVFPIDINCKGAITELNIPLDASAVINNYIEDVDCVDRDKQNDCRLVFKAPIPDESPAVEGCFFLTAAGAHRMSS